MAEETEAAAGGETGKTQVYRIQKVYIKDVSFETPRSTEIFTEQAQWAPEVKVQLNTESRNIKDDIYECTLMITVTVDLAGKSAYLTEVKQAGLFTISGFAEGEMGHLLGSYTPSVLFPFAREVISDLAVKGGFPQLLLDPINFDALYAQHMESKKPQAAPASETQH
ncbi:protein-export chaperone SecB [Chromatiales bacterium (ex Bugula neritina AB1)]|nr:protein-export chaperone SecB [Chromatiales bacterium (ex Bugula neritina AB1)]